MQGGEVCGAVHARVFAPYRAIDVEVLRHQVPQAQCVEEELDEEVQLEGTLLLLEQIERRANRVEAILLHTEARQRGFRALHLCVTRAAEMLRVATRFADVER